jgi:hypothetical protein
MRTLQERGIRVVYLPSIGLAMGAPSATATTIERARIENFMVVIVRSKLVGSKKEERGECLKICEQLYVRDATASSLIVANNYRASGGKTSVSAGVCSLTSMLQSPALTGSVTDRHCATFSPRHLLP